MDRDEFIAAIIRIREECTGPDGQVDTGRYKAAVAELAGHAETTVQSTVQPRGKPK